jgi:hypothetical protein
VFAFEERERICELGKLVGAGPICQVYVPERQPSAKLLTFYNSFALSFHIFALVAKRSNACPQCHLSSATDISYFL